MSGHVSGGDRHGPADRAHGAIRRGRDRTLFRGMSCVSIFAYIGKRKAVPLRGVYIALFKNKKITVRGGWCATGWLVRSGGGMRMRAAACATRHTPSGAARCTRTCELLPSGPAASGGLGASLDRAARCAGAAARSPRPKPKGAEEDTDAQAP